MKTAIPVIQKLLLNILFGFLVGITIVGMKPPEMYNIFHKCIVHLEQADEQQITFSYEKMEDMLDTVFLDRMDDYVSVRPVDQSETPAEKREWLQRIYKSQSENPLIILEKADGTTETHRVSYDAKLDSIITKQVRTEHFV